MPAFNYCPACAAPLVDKIVDTELRRACASGCGFVHYDNPTIALNEELDDYRHVPLERCRVWPAGTGFALRDWLRTRGHEPEMIQISR